MEIDLTQKAVVRPRISKEELSIWVSDELSKKGFDSNWTVEVFFVNDEEIKKLNQRYRSINQPTDVLSFPVFDKPTKSGKGEILGSIIVSIDTIEKQAREHGVTTTQEIEKMVRHSTKHLIGIHHK